MGRERHRATGGDFVPADLVQGALVALGVASLNFADIWLYIVDPVVGGVAAALLYTNLLKPES